jgi:hypothetical protein
MRPDALGILCLACLELVLVLVLGGVMLSAARRHEANLGLLAAEPDEPDRLDESSKPMKSHGGGGLRKRVCAGLRLLPRRGYRSPPPLQLKA